MSAASCEKAPRVEADAARSAHDVAAADASVPSTAPPALRVLAITDLAGVLEPCGCSARTLGGLDRLASALAAARRDGVPTLFLLAGHTFFEPSPREARELPQQERWEAEALASFLRELGADAVLPSTNDLRVAGDRLGLVAGRAGLPLLVGAQRGADNPSATVLSRTTGGLRIAVVGVATGGAERGANQNAGAALARLERDVLGQRRAGADLVIALVSDARADARQYANEGRADLTIAAGMMRADAEWVALPGGALAYGGRAGERLLVAELRVAQRGPAPSERGAAVHVSLRSVPLERDGPRDAAMTAKLRALASKINQYNATSRALAASPAGRKRFAGSQPCAACHTAAYLWWRRSAHGRAFSTLQRLDKEYNLDCVGCHVTGYGEPSGARLGDLEGLTDVGCESCHGASARHVDDPRDNRPRTGAAASACRTCHDAAHSPEFDEATYRARLSAPGHQVSAER